MDNFYIKRTDDAKDLELPKYMTIGSAGMDLYANVSEETILKQGERKLIPTGIMIDIPVGYEAQIRPRSGLAYKHGVTVLNSPGTIDSDYRGEIKALLINHGQEDFKINRGDRICQMVIARVSMISFEEVDVLSDTVRGDGGFGHSGVSLEDTKNNENTEKKKIVDDIFYDISNFKENLSISKVIKYFELKDIVFTKTMIQNYNRVKALPELIDGRFYSREHLVYLYYISILKNDFSLQEIKKVLDGLKDEDDMLLVHQKICELKEETSKFRNYFLNDIKKVSDNESIEKMLIMLESTMIKKM